MRLEHHLVGGYVRYISPHIIIIIISTAGLVINKILFYLKMYYYYYYYIFLVMKPRKPEETCKQGRLLCEPETPG